MRWRFSNALPTRRVTRAAALAGLLVLAAIAPACVTEPTEPEPPRAEEGVPPRMIEAPQAVQDIAGYLVRYRRDHRAFPPTLQALRDAKVMPATGYEPLDGYAYHPNGVGVLEDGRIILLVDRAPSFDDHIWCILQDPLSTANSAAITVTLVRLYELQQAAESAAR